MNAVSERLIAADQESTHYAFGAHVARYADDDLRHARQEMSFETHASAYRLKSNVSHLLESQHPEDKSAVTNIARRFLARDALLAVASLETPRHPISVDENFNIIQWLADASYTEIAQFSLWHKRHLDNLQQQLNKDQPQLQASTAQRVEDLVDSSILPRSACKQYDDTFRHYGFFKAIDTFEAGAKNVDGYTTDTHIAIPNIYSGDQPDTYLNEVVFHEYTHGVGFNEGQGFMYGAWTHPIVMRWLEEHTVAHLTAVSSKSAGPNHDQALPHVYNPFVRQDRSFHPYPMESLFFATLAEQLEEGIPADLLAHAYMTPWSTNEGLRLRRELEQRLVRAVGSQALLFDISDAYEAATKQDRDRLLLDYIDDATALIEDKPANSAVGIISYKA